jgi:hypothetical protein
MIVTVQLFDSGLRRIGVSIVEVSIDMNVPFMVKCRGTYYQLFEIEAVVIYKYRETQIWEIVDVAEDMVVPEITGIIEG